MPRPQPSSTLFPYTTLFRSRRAGSHAEARAHGGGARGRDFLAKNYVPTGLRRRSSTNGDPPVSPTIRRTLFQACTPNPRGSRMVCRRNASFLTYVGTHHTEAV